MIFRGVIFIGVMMMGAPVLAATFTATKNLSFGTLIPITTSGTVKIGLNSAITPNGAVSVAPSGAGYYAGTVVFTGSDLSGVADVVNLSVLDSSVTLNNGAGGTVTVNNFTINPSLQISVENPSASTGVGGDMTFGTASTPGNYTGFVTIRAEQLLGPTIDVELPIILTLWRTLKVTQTRSLNFGGIAVSGGNSVVEISATSGLRTVVSGASGVQLGSGRPGNLGEFTVTGQPNTAITVSFPSSITLTGPGTAMTVNNFTADSTTPTLDNMGNLSLKVGARLNVGTNQAPGTYNGTYTLTVSY